MSLHTDILYTKFSARADRLASDLALELALSAVARREGLSADDLRSGRGWRMAGLRRQALYIAVTHFNRPARSVARAAGLSHEAVRKACRLVEQRREDASFERRMDELEIECMG